MKYWMSQILKHERTARTLMKRYDVSGELRWKRQAETNLRTAANIRDSKVFRDEQEDT